MPLAPFTTALLTLAVICAATAAGMLLAHRDRRRPLWLAIASALILTTALTEVLPDAWDEAVADRVPGAEIVAATVLGFAVITYLTRHDHGSRHRGEHAPGRHRAPAAELAFGGAGTALAMASHRTFESTAVATTATTLVMLTLLLHSAGEGVTLGALLRTARRRPLPWLLLSCAAPVAGAAIALALPPPEPLVPLLLALAAGELLHTALLGLRLLTRDGRRPPVRHLGAALVLAAAVGVPLFLAHTVATAPPPALVGRVAPEHPAPPPRALHAPPRHRCHRRSGTARRRPCSTVR
ncbi:hypothetical protein [Actinocorallia longicatena]|uniref:Zinc transporter ZupT n=1 Tax=Actinocorallia longicatena TaxID=111803 RepID=A0ABP6QBQ0_9ACTN